MDATLVDRQIAQGVDQQIYSGYLRQSSKSGNSIERSMGCNFVKYRVKPPWFKVLNIIYNWFQYKCLGDGGRGVHEASFLAGQNQAMVVIGQIKEVYVT